MRFDRGTDPRATALRLIAECRDAQNTTLDLSSVGLTLHEADVVAGLTSLTSLTSLNLQDNEIGPDGAQALQGFTGLTSLNLGMNTIGAEGAQALKGLTRLTDLELGNCKIGDRGVQALAGLTSLTSLGLGDNDISDEGAWPLSGLTKRRVGCRQGIRLHGLGLVGRGPRRRPTDGDGDDPRCRNERSQ
jgi:hypothetical protein